jgi:DNA-binding response OmpR family regulator
VNNLGFSFNRASNACLTGTTCLSGALRHMQPRKEMPSKPAPIILIVEGNTLVRTLVAAYLRDCGYQVIETSSSAEAVDVLGVRKGIDIVFINVDAATDGDGFGLARRVRNEWPQVKVLLSSGVRRTAKEAETLCEQGPTATKPYDHAELGRRIRRLLGS